jgi:predicted RNA-binding protein
MCEANAYLLKGDKEELIMEAVDTIENENGVLKMRSIFGDQKMVRGTIRRMALVGASTILDNDPVNVIITQFARNNACHPIGNFSCIG